MIPLFKTFSSKKIPSYIKKVCKSGIIGEGAYVNEFAYQLKRNIFGNDFSVLPVNSCTSALHLSLECLNLGPDDEIITTPFTMVATNLAILYCGAKIVWADIDPDTLFIDFNSVKSKITKNTKAVIAVPIGGVVNSSFAKLSNYLLVKEIPFILDCAHSLTSKFDNEHLIKYADFSCFSFQAIKTLTTGDGGAIVIPNRLNNYYDVVEELKWFGMTRKKRNGVSSLKHQMNLDINRCGFKYQMNNIAAAIGLANIKSAIKNSIKVRKNSKFLLTELDKIKNIKTIKFPKNSDPDWWVLGIFANDRDILINFLNSEANITSSPLWRRNDDHTVFQQFKTSLPQLDSIYKKILFIPNGWWLQQKQLLSIIKSIKSFYGE